VDGLAELGYVEGNNAVIEARFAAASPETLSRESAASPAGLGPRIQWYCSGEMIQTNTMVQWT
jgi:hypothetical protein